MAFVLRLVGDAGKNEHDNVGGEVGQRVHRIGYHGRTVSRDAGQEFEHDQYEVDETSRPRHFINLFFPFGLFHFVF